MTPGGPVSSHLSTEGAVTHTAPRSTVSDHGVPPHLTLTLTGCGLIAQVIANFLPLFSNASSY